MFLASFFLLATGCQTVQPEGTTKDILSGDFFAGTEHKDPGPVDYTALEKREAKPPVRWKVEF